MGEAVAPQPPEAPSLLTKFLLWDSPAAQRTCRSVTQRLASRRASPWGTWASVWWTGWRRCGTGGPPLSPMVPLEPGRLTGPQEEEEVQEARGEGRQQGGRSGPKNCGCPEAPRATRLRCWRSRGRERWGTWWLMTQTVWALHSGRSAACCWGRRRGRKEARGSCWSSTYHPRYTNTHSHGARAGRKHGWLAG